MSGINRGSTAITKIYRGSTQILKVYRGSTLIWTSGGIGDKFEYDDQITLPSPWVDLGPSIDRKIGIIDGRARLAVPEGLLGGVFDYRISQARYGGSVNGGDNYTLEVRPATKGDSFSITSLAGFYSAVFARGNNTGSTATNGVGISMQGGYASIVSKVSGFDLIRAEGGTFQGGDVLTMRGLSNVHTLFVNGDQRAQWTDAGPSVVTNSSNRSLIIRCDGGKDLLGPRRFSPALDYVLMA